MPTPINPVGTLSIQNQLSRTNRKESDAFRKAASGKRIDQAGDDVVGIVKAKSLDSAVRGLEVAENALKQAGNLVEVASGGLSSTLSNLQNLREVAVRAADGSLSASDRQNLTAQANSFLEQVDQTAQTVEVDGAKLLDGGFRDKRIQAGSAAGDQIPVSIESATAQSLGVNTVDLSSAQGAQDAITAIDSAIRRVSGQLSELGSASERFSGAIASNQSRTEQLTRSRSVIEDLDYAKAIGEIKAVQVNKAAAINVFATVLNAAKNGKIDV